jgi:hypothetical protein
MIDELLLKEVERLEKLAESVELLCSKLNKEEDYELSDGLFFLSESLKDIANNLKTYEETN